MIDKEKIINRIKHLTEKMKNTDSNFFKHQYFAEIKNLEEGLKRLEEINDRRNQI